MAHSGEDMRVGDSERDRAIALLGEHMSAGRLDVAEFDDRCARAAAARFRSDIRPLFADLPEPRPLDDAPPARRTGSRSARLYGRVALGAVALALIVLAVVTKQLILFLLVIGIVWLAPRRG